MSDLKKYIEERKKRDPEFAYGYYEGFHTRPMSWERVIGKFEGLAEGAIEPSRRREIVDAVRRLDGIAVKDLMALLG